MASMAPITGSPAARRIIRLSRGSSQGSAQLVEQDGVDSLGQPGQMEDSPRALTAGNHRDDRQVECLDDRPQIARGNRTR